MQIESGQNTVSTFNILVVVLEIEAWAVIIWTFCCCCCFAETIWAILEHKRLNCYMRQPKCTPGRLWKRKINACQ